jgi:heme A synthase
VVLLIQVVYGTQLRELAENAQKSGNLNASGSFLPEGALFSIHWFTAILLIGLSVYPVIRLRNRIGFRYYRMFVAIPLTLGLQYVSGVLNIRFGFPMVAQVSHIFFAGLVFGITLYICIAVFRAPKTVTAL